MEQSCEPPAVLSRASLARRGNLGQPEKRGFNNLSIQPFRAQVRLCRKFRRQLCDGLSSCWVMLAVLVSWRLPEVAVFTEASRQDSDLLAQDHDAIKTYP